MAYDQNSMYQPPRRPYHDQRQPDYATNGYGTNGYGSSGGQAYDQYEQGYDDYADQSYDQSAYGYPEPNGPSYDEGYDGYGPRGNAPQSYSDGYYGGYQRQLRANRNFGRSQQRPQQSRPPGSMPPGSMPPDHGQQHYDTHGPPQGRRSDPTNPQNRNRRPSGDRYAEPYDQQSARGYPPAQVAESGHSSSRMGPPTQPHPRGRGKMVPGDWKAQQRAQMEATPRSPDHRSQDNAFPTFPTSRERRPPSNEAEYNGGRSSEDYRKPRGSDISQAHRPQGRRGHSYEDGQRYDDPQTAPVRPQTASGRPQMGRNLSSEERTRTQQAAPPQSRQAERSQWSQQAYQNPVSDTAVRQTHQQQWPSNREPPPVKGNFAQRMASQGDGYGSRYEQDAPGPLNRAYTAPMGQASQQMAPQQPVSRRGPPQVRPIDTSGFVQQQRPFHVDQQPLSPAVVAPRPSTTQGFRSATGTQELSPLGNGDHSATEHDYATPKPWMQTQHTKHESLGDLYDDYGAGLDEPLTATVAQPPQTREEEIEAEMPDFDSAAPGQTSSMPKRTGPADPRMNEARSQTAPPPKSVSSAQYARQAPQLGSPEQSYQKAGGYQNMNPRPAEFAQAGPFDRQPAGPSPAGPGSFENAHQMPYRNGPPPPRRFHQGDYPVQDLRSPEQEPLQPNPDALPRHPVPVRPGLMQQGPPNQQRPPPAQNYTAPGPVAPSGPPPREPGASNPVEEPITFQELNRLRTFVEANPHNPKQGFILVKRLVEAASVLASENGRADPRTTAKNREKYITEAYKRVKRLASSGYSEAQFFLADCYGQGTLGLAADPKEAFNLYMAAAKQGHAQAAYRTAVCCEMGAEDGGGTRRDYPKAVQWYRRAATLGDSAAMFKLGAILLKGLLGQPRNVGEAVTWLKRGADRADQDNPHALHELATLYESGNTNPEVRNKLVADDRYALELFHTAARLGYKFSQFRLGQAYEYGNLGVTTDHRASISWYTKAAAQGEHHAELALSGWYLTGADGILEHSDTEAYLWARKAAMSEPPLAKAMFAMGYFTEQGIGCPASLEEAKKWYGRAASAKFPKALERLEELKRAGSKGARAAPGHGKLGRKDQKRDEAECSIM